MTALIRLTDIQKSYLIGERVLPILKGISMDIQEGESVAIMGPSGSGKSTLLHIMGALDNPSGGHIEIGGHDLGQLGERDLAKLRTKTIGFIFQNFFLLPYYTILQNVQLPVIYAQGGGNDPGRALQLLEHMGLDDRVHHKPHELSGGERQRAAIARALVNNPRIIFADEPTGSLDMATGDSIMELLQSINRAGTTLVIITHDPRVAKRANRILRMSDGVLVP